MHISDSSLETSTSFASLFLHVGFDTSVTKYIMTATKKRSMISTSLFPTHPALHTESAIRNVTTTVKGFSSSMLGTLSIDEVKCCTIPSVVNEEPSNGNLLAMWIALGKQYMCGFHHLVSLLVHTASEL